MEIIRQPRIEREIESFIEKIHPPRVCIDNDSYKDFTVVKIDSANRHGILLEMVQVLTDMELVISKSYISSDGGWLMDVFHVTDEDGKKVTDETLVHYIQKALCVTRSGKEISSDIELQSCNRPHLNLALELTTKDRPGLLAEISTVLLGLGLNVISAKGWAHNDRVGCIIHLEESGPIKDAERLAQIQHELENVVDGRVRLRSFGAGRNQTERRLHQLMYADGDYENGGAWHEKGCDVSVSVGRYEEKGYWVVNVRSRDRPKLLFDTVCVLTDLHYDVFHASMDSDTSMAYQEYFVRSMGNSNLGNESERQKLTLCIIAAIERRISHVCPLRPKGMGLKLDIRTQNRTELLSNVTRVIRENGLSITSVEIGVEGEIAVGSFYVADSSDEKQADPNIVELVRREIGGSIVADYKSPYRVPTKSLSSSKTVYEIKNKIEAKPKFSLRSMLWSKLERLSINYGPIN